MYLRRLFFLACCVPHLAWAQAAEPDSKTLGMVTGPKTGTYIALGNDIAAVAKMAGATIDVKESTGSIDNIQRIASGENAALGIVQSDVLGFLQRSRKPQSVQIANNLRMLFPLYKEEVHIIARKGINSFADLAGKRVIVGDEGSGSLITAYNLFSMMGVAPAEMLKISPPEGVVSVLKNEADAMVFVGGKPVKLFKNMEKLAKSENAESASLLNSIHFVPLNDARMLKEYSPAEITSEDYAFVQDGVPTIAVTAVLVSYDFSAPVNDYHKTRCSMLGKVGSAIRDNLSWLRENGHPKWNETDLEARVGNWKRDLCSWQNIQSNPTPARAPAVSNALEKDLLNVIKGE